MRALITVVTVLAACLASTLAAYHGGYHCVHGRDVMVHLFEWKWTDIAAECERFLAKKGYCAVQVSPVNEHRIVDGPFRPWWQRYQPVSYKLQSRSGSEQQFRDMVNRCNNVGVRIYVDAVINHMTGGGNGRGSAGSSWSGDNQDFPGVPFSNWDFHGRAECSTHSLEIENYQDPVQVRNCRLSGLRDLKHSKPYVSQKIVEFMNNLINMGVAGFRVDAVKHMWPGDTSNIMNRLANLNTRWFPGGTRPFVFQEVIDQGGEPITASQYTHIGRVTEFKYSIKIGEVFRGANGQKLAYLRNFGEGWGFMGGASAAVFVDNHDNQRGHGGGGDLVLNFKSSRRYKMASAFMLAWEYGYPRLMSSYNFDTDWRGPPSDGSGNTNDVPINGDGTCSGGWMCEHRWRQIANMVEFHNVAVNNRVANWWSNNGNQIAFSRGNRAFIAMNLEGYKLQQNLATGLQSGAYCDVISGEKSGGRCSGKTIHVGSDGRANISIEPGSDNNSFYDSFIAIHANSKL